MQSRHPPSGSSFSSSSSELTQRLQSLHADSVHFTSHEYVLRGHQSLHSPMGRTGSSISSPLQCAQPEQLCAALVQLHDGFCAHHCAHCPSGFLGPSFVVKAKGSA